MPASLLTKIPIVSVFGAFELFRSEYEDNSCRIPIRISSGNQLRYLIWNRHLFVVFIVFVEFSVRVHRIWLSTQFCTDFWYYCKFSHWFWQWNYETTQKILLSVAQRQSIYIRTVRALLLFTFGTFDSFLQAGLGRYLNCTVHVALPKRPINQFKPVQQSRQ